MILSTVHAEGPPAAVEPPAVLDLAWACALAAAITGLYLSAAGNELFNPLNPKRYVVVTGMNAWAALPEWKLHPSRHGLCDYFIYDLSSPTPRLIDAGYFPAQVWK
jgi:hypothetical protein